jgi:uncharacterized protein YccT (UPF0319 family)
MALLTLEVPSVSGSLFTHADEATNMSSGTGRHHVKKDQIVFNLTHEQQKQAEECLRKSGHVKITFKEITVTQLPATLDNGEKVD